MSRHLSYLVPLVVLVIPTTAVLAAETRYYQQDGITYCETRRSVEERVPETSYQDCARTVYREQYTTETRDTVQTYWVPSVEYRVEDHWIGRWNPFVTPTVIRGYVPYTKWELRSQVVKTPMATRQLVPETQTVRQPVTTWRTVQREIIDRVAVSGPTPATSPVASTAALPGPVSTGTGQRAVAQPEPIGGVSQIRNEPARYGMQPAWDGVRR